MSVLAPSRFLSPVLGFTFVALLLAGCTTNAPAPPESSVSAPSPFEAQVDADSIESIAPPRTTPPPAATVAKTQEGAPAPPDTPTFTPVASAAQREPTQGEASGPVKSGPVIEWPKPTWLTAMMDALPSSAAATGVWLSNPAKALEFAGLEPAKDTEEFISRTPEQHEEFGKARAGVPNSGLGNVMRQYYADWETTFGFGIWDVRAMAETGEMWWAGFEINLLTGEFDRATVKGKLLSLEYVTRTHSGEEYLSVPEGARPDFESPLSDQLPMNFIVNSNVRNVFTDGGTLLTAPNAEGMEELLSVRAGEAPSLGQHPAFGDLVFTLPAPFFIAILSRKAVLEPEHPPFREYETPADWGDLGDWKAMAAAYSRPSPETQEITLALWYEEPPGAREAAAELEKRLKTFNSPESDLMIFLQEACDEHWKTEVPEAPRGAVLTISCQLESGPGTERLGDLMFSILVEGTLAFLVG